MIDFTASTDMSYYHCLQDERIREARHQRLVRQALQNRKVRTGTPRAQSSYTQVPQGQPFKGTAHS